MNTNPKDFEIFLKAIPKERIKDVWFFPIWANSKKPESKTELKNNETMRLTADQAYLRLKSGSNVGIYGLPGGLMFLDLDVKAGKFLASDELIMSVLNIPSITIKSRNGGLQKYFLNQGKYANQLIRENGVIIGELRTNWQYVVSVGSYVPTDENNNNGDGTYRLNSKFLSIQDMPIIAGLDTLALIEGTKEPKITKAEQRTWNSDNVKAEKITQQEFEISTSGKSWVRVV